MPLPSLYIYATLLEIYKNKDQFLTNAGVHNYHTRNGGDLRTPRFRLSKSTKNSLNIKLFNYLPNNLKFSDNPNKFKLTIKKHFLTHCFYSVEEYLQTPLMI